MVLHQRTKQAFQAKDLSVAYAPVWSDLIRPFIGTRKDQPLVAAWIAFVDDSKNEQESFGRTTSQQQAAAFKKLGMPTLPPLSCPPFSLLTTVLFCTDQAVKMQKEKHSQLLDEPDFQIAFSQFIALYYFASAKLASRKQIFAFIQSLQPHFQPDESDPEGIIVSALRFVVTQDIFMINTPSRIDIDMSWHQRALCLYTTLDYAMGRTAITADVDNILDQLSILLHERVQTTDVEVRDSFQSRKSFLEVDMDHS